MKTKITNFNKIIWFNLPITFLLLFFTTQAQSKKIVQMSPKTGITIDNNDKYKLVFPKVFEGKRFSVGEAEAEQSRFSRLPNLIEQLNELGSQDYRLAFALGGSPIAIVKSDESRYEYDWFQTTSPVFFVKSGFQEKQAEMAKQGFRVIEHFFVSQSCENRIPEQPALGENCEYKDLFLFEKVKGVKKTVEQLLVNTFPGWGKKPSDELEKQIDDKLAEGFYPTNVFSKFEILLERAKDKDDLLSDKPDVQVVRSSGLRDNLEKKVNELAKQGYRLALTSNGIAVMYRNAETAQIPVLYVWVKADKKSFEKDLAKLQAAGAVYRTTYPNEKGTANSLIFEQKLKDDGKRAEFKILNIEFNVKENQVEKKVYVDLTPSSKEAVKAMNALAKESFEVRDLFYTDKVSVILERIR